jgi:hypothetical protein
MTVAAIVVITHHYDVPMYTSKTEDGLRSSYMLGPIIVELASRGHRVTIARGVPTQVIAADIAILHVDLTLVPAEYLEFAASFPICLNGEVRNIAKRTVANGLVRQNTNWAGSVIVKTDLNYRGVPELRANNLAGQKNLPAPFPNAVFLSDYPTFDGVSAVPPAYWLNGWWMGLEFASGHSSVTWNAATCASRAARWSRPPQPSGSKQVLCRSNSALCESVSVWTTARLTSSSTMDGRL